jgi:putative hemolysin
MRIPVVALTSLTLAASALGAEAQSIANPAATFCLAVGGTYKTVREATGDRGICTLPDGREVDAWEYFRERHGAASGSGSTPNPAATFCTDNGGAYGITDDGNGSHGICVLPDGRAIDAWEHFREEHSALPSLDLKDLAMQPGTPTPARPAAQSTESL